VIGNEEMYILRFAIFILVVLCFFHFDALPQEPKLGDVSDGSRAVPVHLIELYDEEGARILPDDHPLLPFSTKQTCLPCHSYETIRHGWHFNAADSTVPPGRSGHPWIYTDRITATQIPLSFRPWPGTFRPESVGLTPFYFIQEFGRQFPGGGVGEDDSSDVDNLALRWMISGKLEINCLACHDADAAHDQAEYAKAVQKQNFRWAAAATAGFALVTGSAKDMQDGYDIYSENVIGDGPLAPPRVVYDPNIFHKQNKVFFNLTRNVPNERCYFCHSTVFSGAPSAEKWEADEDVHLKAGLMCVDCHRNGLDHLMVRGYEGEALVQGKDAISSLSCEGCHVGNRNEDKPLHGRQGAPKPKHTGIPTVHFDILSCTACHSGPWPSRQTGLVKTAMAHGLGNQGVAKGDSVAPYIVSPVFAMGYGGKIAPHHLMWPSFWAEMKNDTLSILSPEFVKPYMLAVIESDTLSDSTNFALMEQGRWPRLKKEHLLKMLDTLTTQMTDGAVAAYISGGVVYRYSKDEGFMEESSQVTVPYLWAFGHDVRPAAQSLGSAGCKDCHAVNSAFTFATIDIPSPLVFVKSTTSTAEFQGTRGLYPRLFALTFYFRPLLKWTILGCGLVMAGILLLYFFKGLDAIIKAVSGDES
jgi:hypothetical protein